MDWGRLGVGIATLGGSELMREGSDDLWGDRTANEFRDINQNDFLAPGLLDQAGAAMRRNAPQAYEGDPFGSSGVRGGNGGFIGSVNVHGRPVSFGGPQGAGPGGPVDSWQHRQLSLANMLQDRARGNNSVAQMQFADSLGRLTAQQQALAASNRRNPGLAAFNAQAQAGTLGGQLSSQAAIARMQEAQQAQAQLGGLVGQARDQTQRMTLANQQAMLDQQRLNDARNFGLQQLYQQGLGAYQDARGQRFNTISGQPTGQERTLGALQSLAEAKMKGGAGGMPGGAG